MTSLEDIFVWADGTCMFREDCSSSVWMSDDFYVIKVGDEAWEKFVEENV